MKDLVSGIRYDASNVISQAIGPSKEFCMGYLNPGVVGERPRCNNRKDCSEGSL